MKHISKIGMMMVTGGLLAATSCSDFSDYNTEPANSALSADKTLWENISGNEKLSDFASVLKRVGYDKILSASHTYTVWAPVNGSFNMDSLANVSNEKVEKEFVNNLIADYTHRESDINDTTVYMLNKKLLKFDNKNTASLTFDTQRVLPNTYNASIFNYPCTNGLLYTVENPSTFRYNAYEIISEVSNASKFLEYVKRFEKVLLDEENSVKGEISNGVQHYDDSVMVTLNYLTAGLLRSQVDNEDSLYTILIPNDETWETSYNTISKYYKYIPTIKYQDLSSTEVGSTKGGTTTKTSATIMAATKGKIETSLTSAPSDAEIQETAPYWNDSIAKLYMVKDFIFSETNKKYNSKLQSNVPFVENDTLFSTTQGYIPNPKTMIEATERIITLSNGHARILNKYPFLAKDTYAPKIKTCRVARCVTASGKGYTTVQKLNVDESICKLEDNETVLSYVRTDLDASANFAPELDFYLPNVLSTTYDIYLVVVPGWFDRDEDPSTANRLPYSLRVDINYTDAGNNQIAGRFDGTTVQTQNAKIRTVKPFITGQDKVDTLKLGRVTFPICYKNTEAKPNIKVMHTFNIFSSLNKKKYEQMLRIANVIMIPVEDNEADATKVE